MRTVKLSALIVFCVSALLLSGCNEALKDCKIQNQTQQEQIETLLAERDACKLQLEAKAQELADVLEDGGIDIDALNQEIIALKNALAEKQGMIASMQQKLLTGTALPPELSTMLEDFAQTHSAIVSFDTNTGIVKFKSDLLFEKGSANVASQGSDAIKSLCGVLNSTEGKKFDVVIAGHTDDIPILKPGTLQDHPTNWHLSAHRGISVLNVMTGCKVGSKRLSVRAFGQYRPVEPNKAANKGNPKNRRVEIYIIPEGA